MSSDPGPRPDDGTPADGEDATPAVVPGGPADDPADTPAAEAATTDEPTDDGSTDEPTDAEPTADGSTADGTAPAPHRRGRDPLAAFLIGVLTLLLGFAFAVQVRSTDTDEALAGARESDLVRILDDVTAQQERLRQEIADQRAALDQLSNSDSASAAALEEARARAEALDVLNGSIAAQGPGITLTIRDPDRGVTSSTLLNAIQELRGAGAETMQVDDVRIGVSSAVTGSPGDLEIDGRPLEAPYVFQVIGSPQDMATAMSIPGGVVSSVGRRGGTVDIVQRDQVVVDALRPLDEPQYAEPADGD